MKERFLTFCLALGALFLFYALFLPKPTPEGAQVSQPLTTERGPNGYFALQHWLGEERVRVLSLRLPEVRVAGL